MDIYTEERPWGKFEKFVENKNCTVKLLYINPNSQTSLQLHGKREEFWKILKGSISLDLDGEKQTIKENETVFIKQGAKHRITTEDESATILEISLGDFDENDIVRLEDAYNRA